MRKIVASALMAGTMLISARNMIEGVGRDVESVGDTVADTAGDNK